MSGGSGSKWAWLPTAMPAIAKLIAEKREKHGAAWVGQCWERGVLKHEPGAFFAAEGALMVGTPANVDLVADFLGLQVKFPSAALLILPDPPAQAGAQP
jgi:hypothetical protein